MLGLDTAVSEIGVIQWNAKTAGAFEKLRKVTGEDLLQHYPRRHEDLRDFDQFPEGPMELPICLHVEVTDCQSKFGGRGRRFFEATVVPAQGSDMLGNQIVLRWFNLAYIQKLITVGHCLVLYGHP